MSDDSLLIIKNLNVTFYTHHGIIQANSHINLTLSYGQTLGIVGESGSGKSVSMMALARLLPQYSKVTGHMYFKNIALHTLSSRQFSQYRGKKILYLFQDPLAALNPYLRVGSQIVESIRFHQKVDKLSAKHLAIDLLNKVEIVNSEQTFSLYPHQCSGGMRQRITLALALACKPEILIADEPTSALDSITSTQIIQLLHQLKTRENLHIILISHDIGIVHRLCTHIAVFYKNQVVEYNTTESIMQRAQHPYTQHLLREMYFMREEKQ